MFVTLKSITFNVPIVDVIALKLEVEISLLNIEAIEALDPDIFVNINYLW